MSWKPWSDTASQQSREDQLDAFLAVGEGGYTDEEVAKATGHYNPFQKECYWKRRNELMDAGLVVCKLDKNGNRVRRMGDGGRLMQVWVHHSFAGLPATANVLF